MAYFKSAFGLVIIAMVDLVLVLGYHDQGVFYLHQPYCNVSGTELIPKSDCSGFYICVDGRTYEETCQDGWVFSHGAHGCVPRGNFIDDCETVTQKCAKDKDGVYPHELECQLFYNCSNSNTVTFPIYRGRFSGYLYVTEPFLQECPYPLLFNVQERACVDLQNVSCGMRNEIVNYCEYWAHKMNEGMGAPCSVYNPSCEGFPDGENMYQGRGWSPFFMRCFKGRTIETGSCTSLNVSDIVSTQLFHPELRMCVPLYRIPKEHGGDMPDCSNQQDGDYPIDFGSCRFYSVCANGAFVDVYACPEEKLFDVLLRECVDQTTARCNLL